MRRFAVIVAVMSLVTWPFAGDARAQAANPQPQPGQPGSGSGAGAQATGQSQGIRPVQDPDKLGQWRASKVIGENVRDANGKNIGKIEDLMMDSDGRVTFAVMSFGGLLGIGDRYFALPWHAMRFDRENGDMKAVVLDATKEQLERAPGFARDRWPSATDRQWGEESKRYWSDTAITGQVKSRLAAEQAGTLTKIDVDTRQGVVQLNGTVENEQMKRRAADVARQVEGVRDVVNNLKVGG